MKTETIYYMIERKALGNRQACWRTGDPSKYSTLEEAKHQVKRLSDDWQPRFRFRVIKITPQ